MVSVDYRSVVLGYGSSAIDHRHLWRGVVLGRQRTGEIGVRMALGADTTAIHALVIRQALFPLVPGLVAGVAASLGIQQLMATLVFDVSPRDPLTIVAVCASLTVVAIGAAYIPSRRAMRVSPVIVLRYE